MQLILQLILHRPIVAVSIASNYRYCLDLRGSMQLLFRSMWILQLLFRSTWIYAVTVYIYVDLCSYCLDLRGSMQLLFKSMWIYAVDLASTNRYCFDRFKPSLLLRSTWIYAVTVQIYVDLCNYCLDLCGSTQLILHRPIVTVSIASNFIGKMFSSNERMKSTKIE